MMRVMLAVFACVAVSHGLPAEIPCICTMEFAPVCGMDGITYSNKCGMDCAGVELNYVGECAKVCPCPRDYRPVCGQDGKTYSNQCEMNCAGVAFFQDGVCTAVPASGAVSDGAVHKRAADPCICTLMYLPVCGSDGVTYDNECNLLCVGGVSKVKDGDC